MQKALRWIVLFFFDAHAVLFTLSLLSTSSIKGLCYKTSYPHVCLIRVFDWAKMQTIPWGVCGFFLWKVSFKWNQRVLQKVEGFEATRLIWETIKSNFTKQNFCLYICLYLRYMWLLILSNQPWEGLTGVECHTLQCSLLLSGFFQEDAPTTMPHFAAMRRRSCSILRCVISYLNPFLYIFV